MHIPRHSAMSLLHSQANWPHAPLSSPPPSLSFHFFCHFYQECEIMRKAVRVMEEISCPALMMDDAGPGP